MIAFTIFLPIIALGVATAIGLIVFLLWHARNVLAFLAIGGLMLFGILLLVGFVFTRVSMEQQHAFAAQHEAMAREAAVKQAMEAQGFGMPVGHAIEFHNGTVTVSPAPPMPPMPPVPQVAVDHQLQPAAVMPMVAANAASGETTHPSPMVVPGQWTAQAPVAPSESPASPAVVTASAVAEQPAPATPADEVKVDETPAPETPATPEETPTAEVPAEETPTSTPLFEDAEQASETTTAEATSTDSTDQEAVASEPATPAVESAEATEATAEAAPVEATTTQGVAEAEQPATTSAEVPAEVKQDELAPLQTETPSATADAGRPAESTPTSSAEAPAAAAPSTAATLSVPAWVENPPREIDGRRVDVLISEPFEIRSDCERDLDRKVAESVYRYACEIAAQSDKFLPVSAGIHPEIAQLARREQYTKVHASSVGDMQVVYQLVVFDENVQRRVEDWVRAEGVHESLKRTTGVSAMALGLLAGVFGIFRLAARRSPDPLNV